MDNSYGVFSTLVALIVAACAMWLALAALAGIVVVCALVAAFWLGCVVYYHVSERKAENSNPNPVRDRSG